MVLKELSPEVPVVYVTSVRKSERPTLGRYYCPVYFTTNRGGANLVTLFDIAMESEDTDEKNWILSGVALFLAPEWAIIAEDANGWAAATPKMMRHKLIKKDKTDSNCVPLRLTASKVRRSSNNSDLFCIHSSESAGRGGHSELASQKSLKLGDPALSSADYLSL